MASGAEMNQIPLTRCFVIGPIGDQFADDNSPARLLWEEAIFVYEKVIQPACKAVGLDPIRSDHMSRPGEIQEQIFRELRDAPVVIADLTGANPNVMYELGMRHTTGTPTVQIGEAGRLPFDVSAIRTIMFKRSSSGYVEARDALKETLRLALDGDIDMITPSRVWLGLQSVGDLVLAHSEREGESDELGFVERLALMEEANPRLLEVMEQIAHVTQSLGEQATEYTREIQKADARGGNVMGARLAILRRYETAVHPLVQRMEELATDMGTMTPQVIGGYNTLFDAYETDASLRDNPQAVDLINVVVNVSATAAESVENVEGFYESVEPIGRTTKGLGTVVKRLRVALRRIIDSMTLFVALGERGRGLIATGE